MAYIDNMKEDVGFDHFFQCSFERGDKMMRKFPDKPDGIWEKYLCGGRKRRDSRRGVECCEEAVLDECPGVRQRVEIGVAHERDVDKFFSSLPPSLPLESDLFELFFKMRNALPDHSAVGLDLSFAGSLCADAAELFR